MCTINSSFRCCSGGVTCRGSDAQGGIAASGGATAPGGSSNLSGEGSEVSGKDSVKFLNQNGDFNN